MPPQVSKLSKRKRALFHLIIYVALAASFLIAAEIVLRVKGWHPWEPGELDVSVEPGGRLYAKHPSLGYVHLPGQYRITLNHSYTFRATYGDDGLRITHPSTDASLATSLDKDEIWIFGCSFTDGWSLNDEETYAWVLQEKLPAYEVRNFGVDGYGNLQALIQLQEALASKRKPPRVAVVTYASFHDQRNTFLRSWRKISVPYNKLVSPFQPYARLGANQQLQFFVGPVEYAEFPLMRRSAFAHFIETRYNLWEDSFYQSNRVSRAVIRELAELCRRNNITLVVAGIYNDATTQDVLRYCESEGWLATDISVDLRATENMNLPYDSHPSPLANQRYAQKLETFLRARALR